MPLIQNREHRRNAAREEDALSSGICAGMHAGSELQRLPVPGWLGGV
jgi:hypothetical protein